MGVLREYHAEMGALILAHEGTLERFTGDGMMIFFNDPVPVENPAERAIRMALAMRERVAGLVAAWRRATRRSGPSASKGAGTMAPSGSSPTSRRDSAARRSPARSSAPGGSWR